MMKTFVFLLTILIVGVVFTVPKSYSDSLKSNSITGSGLLVGTSKNDNIVVSPPNVRTTIDGKGGDDSIKGSGSGTNTDQIRAGSGDDTVIGDPASDQQGADDIYGEDGNDALSGVGQTDYINGGGGGDRIYGDAQNDLLSGGSGNDYLYGGADDDILRGGPDSDKFDCGSGEFDVVQDFQRGIDKLPVLQCEIVKTAN